MSTFLFSPFPNIISIFIKYLTTPINTFKKINEAHYVPYAFCKHYAICIVYIEVITYEIY